MQNNTAWTLAELWLSMIFTLQIFAISAIMRKQKGKTPGILLQKCCIYGIIPANCYCIWHSYHYYETRPPSCDSCLREANFFDHLYSYPVMIHAVAIKRSYRNRILYTFRNEMIPVTTPHTKCPDVI